MVSDVREIRGIPIWLLREYLEKAGGVTEENGRISGPGWMADLEQIEDFQIGSLRVGQVRLAIEGEEKAVTDLQAVLAVKLLRGGG